MAQPVSNQSGGLLGVLPLHWGSIDEFALVLLLPDKSYPAMVRVVVYGDVWPGQGTSWHHLGRLQVDTKCWIGGALKL